MTISETSDGPGMDRDRLVDRLNDLIRVTEDSHLGYRQASEACQSEPVKLLLNDMGARRGAIVRDLQRLVATLGAAPEASGTLLGGAQRLLADIRGALGGKDERTTLADLVTLEETTRGHYRFALEEPALPEELRRELEVHHNRIAADLDRLEEVRAAG